MVNKVFTFLVCAILLALSTLAMASSARDAPGIVPNDVSLSHNGTAITAAIPAPTDTFTLFAVDPWASPTTATATMPFVNVANQGIAGPNLQCGAVPGGTAHPGTIASTVRPHARTAAAQAATGIGAG